MAILTQRREDDVESGISSNQSGDDLKFSLMGDLARPGAPRILTTGAFALMVQKRRAGAAPGTARAIARLFVSAGALYKVSSGVFLNRRAMPPAELHEVAPLLRAGSVVSLHSVLGECGFINNPSSLVTAVVPTSMHSRPRLGAMTSPSGDNFRFFGLSPKFFAHDEESARLLLQSGRACAMFRPEAALLHWIHLGSIERSTLPLPPVDVDMDCIDMGLVRKLAQRWDMVEKFEVWLEHASRMNFGEQSDVLTVRPGSAAEKKAQADAAKARVMSARRRINIADEESPDSEPSPGNSM